MIAIKKILFALLVLLPSLTLKSQTEVSHEQMEAIFYEVKTPFKYGLEMTAPAKGQMADSPSIFRKGKWWYMYYIVFDGKGYETWMARSRDLLHWETMGRALTSSSPDDWDSSVFSLNNTDSETAPFNSNPITASEWSTLEQHGAVFLPAAGYRNILLAAGVGLSGNYWSASRCEYLVGGLHFCDAESDLSFNNYYSCYGFSVRLVSDAQ